jgi:hypothetical protein
MDVDAHQDGHEQGEEASPDKMAVELPPPVPAEHPDKVEARTKLRRPDGIMEPDCFDALKMYIRHKGDPLETISFLSDNYVGYADLCNLVCTWLRQLGATDEEILKIVEDFFKDEVKQNFTVQQTDDIFRQGPAVRLLTLSAYFTVPYRLYCVHLVHAITFWSLQLAVLSSDQPKC